MYGILSSNWLDDSHSLLNINSFEEKPDSSCAEKHLFMLDSENNHEYYSVFGQYIITPELFNVLGSNINKERTNKSEIDMTDSLKHFIGKGLTGVVLNDTMYDIGAPSSYHASFDDFK